MTLSGWRSGGSLVNLSLSTPLKTGFVEGQRGANLFHDQNNLTHYQNASTFMFLKPKA